jgi:HSP20 family protein
LYALFWSDPFAPLITQFGRTAPFVPAADVTVGEGDFVLTLDLPGLTADDVSIELLGEELIVRGERSLPEVADGAARVYAGRPFGRFERRFHVPRGVDPDGITASMDHGVLSLIVRKPERLQPKAIAIGSATKARQLETATA